MADRIMTAEDFHTLIPPEPVNMSPDMAKGTCSWHKVRDVEMGVSWIIQVSAIQSQEPLRWRSFPAVGGELR